jgi:predicted rRNA methylase YqxC with S4 and FtsJ domains
LSFISLTKALPAALRTKALPAALRLAAPDAWLVALVTPQFEAGRRLWAKASSSVRRKRAPRPWRRYGPLST